MVWIGVRYLRFRPKVSPIRPSLWAGEISAESWHFFTPSLWQREAGRDFKEAIFELIGGSGSDREGGSMILPLIVHCSIRLEGRL